MSADNALEVEQKKEGALGVVRKILVVSGFLAGSTKANAINTVKMAEGFAQTGASVTLATRGESDWDSSRFADAYSLEATVDWLPLHPRLGHGLGFALRMWPIIRDIQPDLVFARNFSVPALADMFGVPCVFETHAHMGACGFWFRRAISATRRTHCYGLITISPVLRDYYISMGARPDKVKVIPTGVHVDRFRPPLDVPSSPYRTSGPNVTYSGHLYDYKGIPTILAAAAECPKVSFHLVGGLPEDLDRVKGLIESRHLENVHLHGNKTHAELPPYLWHADVLLLPPSADHPSAHWTSPVKLGEYMASGTPIIASDIPALRRLVGENDMQFVSADNARQLAGGIRELISNPEIGRKCALSAAARAATWSYEQRARQVMSMVAADTETSASV